MIRFLCSCPEVLITKVMLCRLCCVCVCVCVCMFISFHRRGCSLLKQNNKCNARDQTSDVVMRKLLCVKYLHGHVIDIHSRDCQASSYARKSIKPGGATRSKRKLLELSISPRQKCDASLPSSSLTSGAFLPQTKRRTVTKWTANI